MPVLLICAISRRIRIALAHAFFIAVNLWVVAPAWFGRADANGAGVAIDVATINVHTRNRDYQRVIGLVRQQRPDIVVFLEVDERWLIALRQLADSYPYRHSVPRADNFGIAVFSVQPLGAVTHYFVPDGVPSVIGTATISGRAVRVVATHPLNPVRRNGLRGRDQQLGAVCDFVVAQSDPVVVLGDLNTSCWAPAFRTLLAGSGLRDPRRGRGVLATWPSPAPVMALDHVLASGRLCVSSLSVGPEIGSDHRPLFARVQYRQ